ncbi:MAG: hypothetical protein E7011_01225 [Alphaproteobacteria bacterium]|nr:hypothetical protein [Alphaproteobacteria bacterium]
MNKSKLSTWLLWAPLRFALLTFIASFATVFIFSLIANFTNWISDQTFMTCIFAILQITFITTIIITIKKLPRDITTQQSFIAVHTAQSGILYIISAIQFYIFSQYSADIFSALFSPNRFAPLLILSLFSLYIFGIFITNIYAKYCRIRSLNIPMWKIVLTVPFGFSALWVPGYFLDAPANKHTSQSPNTRYNKLVQWISARPTHTAAAFIILTLLSCLCFSFRFVLLTCIMALIFGIWLIQVGTKQFIKQMPKTYTNIAIILNITIILTTLIFNTVLPQTTPDIQINMSDIELTTEPTTQGQ